MTFGFIPPNNAICAAMTAPEQLTVTPERLKAAGELIAFQISLLRERLDEIKVEIERHMRVAKDQRLLEAIALAHPSLIAPLYPQAANAAKTVGDAALHVLSRRGTAMRISDITRAVARVHHSADRPERVRAVLLADDRFEDRGKGWYSLRQNHPVNGGQLSAT